MRREGFLLTQQLFPCVCRPFSHVSGQRRPRDTLSGGLISQYKIGMLIPGSNQRVRSSSDCEHQTSEAYVKAVITYTTDLRKLDKPEAVILDGTLTSIYLLLTSAKQRSQRVTLLTLTCSDQLES